MKKSIGQVAARKEPSTTTTSNVKVLTDRLTQASQFIKSNQKDILGKPIAEMHRELLVASFCVLRRMGAAVNRRLGQVQPRVEALFATMPTVKAGEPGHTIEAGPFKVTLNNKAANKKVLDPAVARDVLRERRIPMKSVMTEVPAPQPYLDEEKVAILVREGKLSEADYQSMFRAAPPSLELRAEVPDLLDDVIQSRLLGGIRDGK